ncbi:MAG: hypothetical protein Q4C67_11115 [Deinococcus sp.]|nr:hypothetical protein [Deinococcus sp.]
MWFLWGVPWLFLVAFALAGMWAWAAASGQQGALGRSVGTALMVGVTLWVLWAVWAYGSMTLSPHNPLPFSFLFVLLAALPALLLLSPFWRDWRTVAAHLRHAPAAPWLWLAGGLALALWPPLRVDCRGMAYTDTYLKSSSEMQGFAGQNVWSKHPEQVPGRTELPADFRIGDVDAAVTHCTRPLSFRASQPFVVMFLAEQEEPRRGRTYSAVFSAGDHRKLTPWTRTAGYLTQPQGTSYAPRLWPEPGLDAVWPVLPELPPELAAKFTGR